MLLAREPLMAALRIVDLTMAITALLVGFLAYGEYEAYRITETDGTG